MSTIGDYIKKERKKAGLTQEDFAIRSGLGLRFVRELEQGKETALNNANKYRNEKLPEAQAQADQIIQDAEAQKQVRINEAEAEVARFNAMYEEYVKNPETTKMRMFYETMEDVLPGMKIVIDNGSGVEKILPLDSFSGDWKTEEDTSEETK